MRGGLEPYYRSLLYPNWQAALAYVDANGAPPSNNPNNYMNYFGDAQRTDYLGIYQVRTPLRRRRDLGPTRSIIIMTRARADHRPDRGGRPAGPVPHLLSRSDLKQVFGGSGYALRTTEYGIDRKGAISTLAIRAGDHEIELGGWYEQ